MATVCKGICVRFRATGYVGKHRYEKGQKRCPVCEIFMTYPEVRCPCCSIKLRVTPRGNNARKEIQKKRNCVWH
ncbi:hypothetical protein SCCGRSA3_01876 [Marine Group I thaumarchaeote SCGC RSA3]|uniref:Uncharacterized protein n=3 Tax=Marine Group I TaxID=905826 RepID=A0A081RM75_9ARCH|nr:hypothetical protein AAA799N04_01263 [Marine Group I thaumarchaeote SCGC AAA799-N04]KFM15905.1 hypothetical protein AAA799D11_01001 [Marine Group I thaumarchaeote SCGC AAA799-D11]KFM17471.1 hypothetical protein SCCGRSA3_01876 [Marine Group I thaumarchaeote SCGC RSA3]